MLGKDDSFQSDEDEIRQRQKLNSIATIFSLRVKPFISTCIDIPLCRLLAMPMVRSTLSTYLSKQEQELVHGYREGATIFYVITTNEEGKT